MADELAEVTTRDLLLELMLRDEESLRAEVRSVVSLDRPELRPAQVSLWGIDNGAIKPLWLGFHVPGHELEITFDGMILVGGMSITQNY